jgi:hypothetical protein
MTISIRTRILAYGPEDGAEAAPACQLDCIYQGKAGGRAMQEKNHVWSFVIGHWSFANDQ